MSYYDFSTLNSSDLEELSCDLMNMSQEPNSKIKYKTFKDGKDKGIDFLYSSEEGGLYDHVGQVKHYYRTGYSGLLSKLKTEEIAKVKKLNPIKFIFFTSIDLSVAQTEEIKRLFNPFIKTLNDVFGKKDINKLIADHPKILELHFKLWLNDFKIIKKILASSLEFRSSQFVENELKKRLRLFVKTTMFDSAKESLENNKFIIITGEPGVGKTTLAEMLVIDYIAKDYTLSYVLDDIKELEEVLSADNSKQIIYFDDFLGSNSEEISKSKGSESRLIKILNSITRLDNKLLILTTRSFILNTFIEESERLKRYNLISKTSLLELTEYDSRLKSEIYNNHVEEAEIGDEYKAILKQELLKRHIIYHNNFTPRAMEYITSKFIAKEINANDYENFIRETLRYPSEIWRHAYIYQIKEDDRLLLSSLFSFIDPPEVEELEKAYLSRVNYEIRTNNKTKEINTYKRTLSRINGGLIIIKKKKVHFINPSLKDFLINFLKEDKDEMDRIVNSIVFANQLSQQLFERTDYTPNISEELKNRLVYDHESFIRSSQYLNDKDLIQLAIILKKNFRFKEVNQLLIDIIYKIDDWKTLHEKYELNVQFRQFLELIRNDHNVLFAIQSSIHEIVNELVLGEDDIELVIKVLSELKTTFDLDFTFGFSEIIAHFDELFSDLIANELKWLRDYALDESEVDDRREYIEDLVAQLNNLGFEYSADFSEFEIDWFEITSYNEFQRLMEKDD